MDGFTAAEERFCETIKEKDRTLRSFLQNKVLPERIDAREWLAYLIGIKSALGNMNNDLGFVATLLVKHYLQERFGVSIDAAGKPQGASGRAADC